MKDNVPFINRISFRVPVIILIVLLIGIGTTIIHFLRSQNMTIIDSKENEIKQEAKILYTAIKNNMLAGEAPIAVQLFRDFRSAEFISQIKLYRANGISAFSDNMTIQQVNRNLKEQSFMEKTVFVPREKISDPDFQKTVATVNDVFVRNITGEKKSIMIYQPLINQPKCSSCHGLNHVIRGVILISAPVNEVYNRTRYNTFLSIIIYAIVVFILTTVIILFLKRVIISRVLLIGSVVEGVGNGDFKTKVNTETGDEIGVLALRINHMIDGLNERFKLTKFVSKSTLDHVQSQDEVTLGGEKKEMTVLFSDLRGFTSFSENRDPELVLSTLNKIMNMQSDIINEFGGDIDKFVGDELMAVFEGDDMVLRAVRAAEKIKNAFKSITADDGTEMFVGIGINTGEMISGNMGSHHRIDRTVIGDAVNLGARLCSAAGKNTIVLSEYSYRHVRNDIEVLEHEPIKVKGKMEPVKIYTLRRCL